MLTGRRLERQSGREGLRRLLTSWVMLAVGGLVVHATGWTKRELVPSDAAPWGSFGQSVAVSGDVGVIGAVGDNDRTRAAYVLRRDGTDWIEEHELLASDDAAGALFGISLAVSGEIAVIGAHRYCQLEAVTGRLGR